MLNDKQKRFCDEYLVDLNGTQAAIRAGYSEKTATEQSSRLLTNVNVQEYIQKCQKKLADKLDISQERILAEYAKIAFSDIRNYFDDNGRLKAISELDGNAAAALSTVEVDELWGMSMDGRVQIGDTKKVKMWDKLRALESLGKHLGIFEKDNSQKQPAINISNLGADDLKALLAIKKKVSG